MTRCQICLIATPSSGRYNTSEVGWSRTSQLICTRYDLELPPLHFDFDAKYDFQQIVNGIDSTDTEFVETYQVPPAELNKQTGSHEILGTTNNPWFLCSLMRISCRSGRSLQLRGSDHSDEWCWGRHYTTQVHHATRYCCFYIIASHWCLNMMTAKDWGVRVSLPRLNGNPAIFPWANTSPKSWISGGDLEIFFIRGYTWMTTM